MSDAPLEPTEQPEGTPSEAEPAKPARRRTRAAAPAAEASADAPAAAEEKPKRTRARAKPAAEETVAEEAPATEEEAPKPARRRRPAAKPVEEPVAEEAAAEEPEAAEAGEAPASRRRRIPSPPPLPRLGRGRRRADASRSGVVVYAKARYVRSSARKARLVCDHIRGKSVPEARAILAFAPRGVAKDWSKLLESAVANAEHNFELVGEELHVKEIKADVGPTLKRFRPRAQGRATPINKRTSHLSIALAPKE
jgi:ribosomal protein L22